MNPFEYLYSLNHHAYFLHSFKDVGRKLKEHIKDTFNISYKRNPDFFHDVYDILGIDDSRRFKELHAAKSFGGGKRIFIIETRGITHEAQNALLKIVEEPHVDVHIFFVMPSLDLLVPTLRSRLAVLNFAKSTLKDEGRKFFKLSKKERIDYVDDLAKRVSDEKATLDDVRDFLASLTAVLYEGGLEKNAKPLAAVAKAERYLSLRSPSIKQLLEYVVLV